MIRVDCSKLPTDEIGASEPMRDAYTCFLKNGYAILDHVLDEAKVQALAAEFTGRYTTYLEDRVRADTLKVGDRRFLVPIELAGAFADPDVYGNPFVVALARQAFGLDAILETFGGVVALDGAGTQHLHRDGPPLFAAGPSALLPTSVAALFPAHAMTVALPLVEMNEHNGTTTIWPGSHRWRSERDRDENAPSFSPVVPVGSAFLWDYRLYHCGTPNVSGQPRPIVYGTYAQPWYRDTLNFRKGTQSRLWFGDGFLKGVPKDRRGLFVAVD